MLSMDFKGYGVFCTLHEDKLVVAPQSFMAKKALGSDEPRVIFLDDIVFLDFTYGNIFRNAFITVGEMSGKTYIPVVPWGDNVNNLEVFYNALYERVKRFGRLADEKPAGLRNDHIQALRDSHGIVNKDMEVNLKSYGLHNEVNDAILDEPDFSKNRQTGRNIQVTEYEENMPPIVATEYAIIDLETTGLSPAKGDKIIEIGIMIVDAGYNIVSRHETLVNPKRPVTLTEVHKITDRMVQNAPTIEDIQDDVLALLHNRIVVAHNAGFEQKFLNAELYGRDLTANNFLDTLKYARLITPTENHKLGTVASFYNVPYVDAHTAMGDVIVLHQVLAHMLPTNPNSRFIASEDLTPYFHTGFGDTQPHVNSRNWVKR